MIVASKLQSATISKTPTDKYFISILVDTGIKLPQKYPIHPKTSIGVDLGVKNFLITSKSEVVKNPKYLRNFGL